MWRCMMVHNNTHYIKMTNTWLKCKAPYCDRHSHSCIIIVHYVSYELTYIFLHPKTMCPCPSLSKKSKLVMPYPWGLEDAPLHCNWIWVHEWTCRWHSQPCRKTWKCSTNACRIPTVRTSPCHWRYFSKVKASAFWTRDEVSLLLLRAYGYDPTVFKVWDSHCTYHIIRIHMQCALPFSCVLWHRCHHITTKDLRKPCVGVSTWVCWNIEMRTEGWLVGLVPKWQCGDRASHCCSGNPTSSNAKTSSFVRFVPNFFPTSQCMDAMCWHATLGTFSLTNKAI